MRNRPVLKYLLFAALIWGVALCAGCSLNKQFVIAVDRSWSLIRSEYTKHIETCSEMDENSKKIALRHAQSLTELIEEAKRE